VGHLDSLAWPFGRSPPAWSSQRSAAAPAARPVAARSSSHVVVIVMENTEASDVLGHAPYVDRLARRYGLATHSYAIRHPSLPNYIALTSGSTQGITDDCDDCHAGGRNVVDQLEGARLSWRAYFEDMPGSCYRGGSVGGYTKHHNPFAYFDDVAGRRARCHRLVTFSRLSGDLRHRRLPAFAFIVPNKCHDMHDCDVATGDRFLGQLVPKVLRALGPHGFLVLTWDEGSTGAGCCGVARGGQIATVVAGPDVRRGARMRAPVDHYGVLRTIEDALGLGRLGAAADRRNGSLRPLFRRPPRVR
jgi:phosphatidylinositol-3-phosphatase